MDNIKLLRDCVLVKVALQTQGIELPEDVKERRAFESTEGVAVALGPECEVVKIGDRVLYKGFIGNEVKDDTLPRDAHYIIVSENDILIAFPPTTN